MPRLSADGGEGIRHDPPLLDFYHDVDEVKSRFHSWRRSGDNPFSAAGRDGKARAKPATRRAAAMRREDRWIKPGW
jgi:hypothetical protein